MLVRYSVLVNSYSQSHQVCSNRVLSENIIGHSICKLLYVNNLCDNTELIIHKYQPLCKERIDKFEFTVSDIQYF